MDQAFLNAPVFLGFSGAMPNSCLLVAGPVSS
jgi:hypothetical protein